MHNQFDTYEVMIYFRPEALSVNKRYVAAPVSTPLLPRGNRFVEAFDSRQSQQWTPPPVPSVLVRFGLMGLFTVAQGASLKTSFQCSLDSNKIVSPCGSNS